MTISLKHDFHSEKGDGTDPTKVQPSNWNEEHVLTMATAKVLGRTSADAGPVQELDASPLGLAILAAVNKAALAALGVFTTGDAKLTFKSTADAGWVLLDDGTIGNAVSSATTRANADVADLYVVIWDSVGNTYAPVAGGRGGTAIGDFNAGKPMALPKALGRALVIAGTGAGLTNRVLGSTFGEETHLLTSAEIPAHTHPVAITDPGHFHGTTRTDASSSQTNGGSFPAAVNASNTNTSSAVTGITAVANNNTGGGGVHNNTQASVGINVMVKL